VPENICAFSAILRKLGTIGGEETGEASCGGGEETGEASCGGGEETGEASCGGGEETGEASCGGEETGEAGGGEEISKRGSLFLSCQMVKKISSLINLKMYPL
jgi:hypothetical protein